MYNRLLILLLTAILTASVSAQDIEIPESDTSVSTKSIDAKPTSGSTLANRYYNDDIFEARWKREAAIYKEAGIADDKIEKVHDLNHQLWKARGNGEKLNYPELVRKRAQLLTPAELLKVRQIRDKSIGKVLTEKLGDDNDADTSGVTNLKKSEKSTTRTAAEESTKSLTSNDLKTSSVTNL